MSTAIAYQNRHLGNIRYDSLRKNSFVACDLGCLETLLGLKPTDIVQVEENSMPFDQFREKYLAKIDAFYPSVESWVTRLIEESTRQIISP